MNRAQKQEKIILQDLMAIKSNLKFINAIRDDAKGKTQVHIDNLS